MKAFAGATAGSTKPSRSSAVMRSVMTWLLPRDDKFFTLLEQHGEVLGDAAKVMAAFVSSASQPQDSLEGIRRIEHHGDDLVHKVTIALGQTFVTPIDREDLHNLATSLHSVLAFLDSAVNAFVTYEVLDFTPAMRELIALCTEAAQVLKEAIPCIRKRQLDKLLPARQKIATLEKRGDAACRAEQALLFKNDRVDAKDLLRQQAVLDALAAALKRCQDAADVLENVAVKHG
jgi:uncharacterized protein Yka (UPF0111/DUF47 family)